MIAPQLARLRARIDAWLRATSLGRRLTLLSLLSVAGLTMLLALNLLSSGLKDAYFDSIEVLNVQQRQLQHFNTETARLQAAIQQYLAVPDEALVRQIDGATELLFAELDTTDKTRADYASELASLRQSLQSFVAGYQELKRINLEIDRIYHRELLESAQQSARLLSLMLSSSAESKGQTLTGPASRSLIDAFVDALLKMNAYYARREVNVSLATRTSLERVAQLSPLIEQLTHDAFERAVLRDLGERTHRMISGLGSLQRAYARRAAVMERQIEASQRDIARVASSLDERHAGIEAELRARYTSRLSMINALSVMIGAVVIGVTLLLGALVAASIREPLRALLRTVEAFSRGRFDEPVPDVGDNELGRLAGALREFRQSAGQRALAERALRESEARLRTRRTCRATCSGRSTPTSVTPRCRASGPMNCSPGTSCCSACARGTTRASRASRWNGAGCATPSRAISRSATCSFSSSCLTEASSICRSAATRFSGTTVASAAFVAPARTSRSRRPSRRRSGGSTSPLSSAWPSAPPSCARPTSAWPTP